MGDLLKNLSNYGKQFLKNAIKDKAKQFALTLLKNPYVLCALGIILVAALIVFAVIGAFGLEAEAQGTISANTDYVVKTDEPNSAPVITDIATLQEALGGYPTNSKLLAEAQTFLDMQETYNVNAIFCAAVAIQETTAGTNGSYALDGHNWFNYVPIEGIDQLEGYQGTQGRWCKWDSDYHGIMGFGYYISQHTIYYFSKGEYTVSAIGSHYCSPSDPWIANVKSFMTQLYEAAGIVVSTGGTNSEMSKGTEIVGTFTSNITGRTFTIINQNVLQNTRGSNWSGYCNRAVSVCVASAYSNKDISTMIDEAYAWSGGLPMRNDYFNQYGLKYTNKSAESSNYQEYFKNSLQSGNYLAIRFNASYTSNSGVTWTDSGHWVAIIGFKTENGTDMMYVADSTSRYNSGWYRLDEFTNCSCLQYIIEISEN